MKFYTHTLAFLCLFISCNLLTANENYNSSMLYLSLPFSQSSIEANLGGQQMEKQGDMFVAAGIAPGTYLLKVSKKQQFQPSVATNSDSYEFILYYGYITIGPKRVIFAKVDASQHLRILGERNTKTVSIEHSLELRPPVFRLRDS